jgi:hypothetical protein
MSLNPHAYTFERVTAKNLPDLVKIFKESREIDISIDELLKKYQTGFCGKGLFGYFAYTENGDPAAFYGIFPSYVKLNGLKVLAAQTGDVITHKDHQRKGLFIQVAEKTAELARISGIELLWGVPNENSSPGFLKNLHWRETNKMRVFSISVKGIPVFRILNKLKLNRLYLQWISKIEKYHFLNKNLFKGPIMIGSEDALWKDAEFNQYKNYSSSFFIKYKGLNIWAKTDGVLCIGDMENPLNILPAQVLIILKKLCRLVGLNAIQFEMSPNSYWHVQLEQVYKSVSGGPICFFPISVNSEKFDVQLTGSDIDIF